MPRHYHTYDYYVVPLGGEDTNARITELMVFSGIDPNMAETNLPLGKEHKTKPYHVPFETMLVIWFSMASNPWLLVKCYRKSKKSGAITSVPLRTFEENKTNPSLQSRLHEMRRLRAEKLKELAPLF